MSSDAELILMAKDGDEQALDILMTRYRKYLVQRSERRLDSAVVSRVDASDITQMTLLEIARDVQTFRGTTRNEWKAWIRKILDHNIRNGVRDHKITRKRSVDRQKYLDAEPENGKVRRDKLISNESSPIQEAIRSELKLEVETLLKSLPTSQRDAVRMRHIEGRTLEEISVALGRTKDSVAGLIKRGLQSIRKQCGQWGNL